MPYPLLALIEGAVLILLAIALFKARKQIRRLIETLADEKRKRSMPLLEFTLDTDDFETFLINDSYCYARNVVMDDVDVIVDYGFKKHITLTFDPIAMLKPNEKIKLNYHVFDGDYDITTTDDKNILHHFSDAPITIHLHYENMEGTLFAATIGPNNGRYITKEIKALDE